MAIDDIAVIWSTYYECVIRIPGPPQDSEQFTFLVKIVKFFINFTFGCDF